MKQVRRSEKVQQRVSERMQERMQQKEAIQQTPGVQRQVQEQLQLQLKIETQRSVALDGQTEQELMQVAQAGRQTEMTVKRLPKAPFFGLIPRFIQPTRPTFS
ncbi:hypothetical protein OAP18_02305 [Gammaproteobacteria bacterium]|nr:hypothetical protein [Gammaproteobacteria bacterium]